MPEIRNDAQIITFSEVGGTVIRWQFCGIDILYPQKMVMRDRKLKLRGGMHVCFPNFGMVNPEFGLPQHGPLRNRKADEVMANGVVFRGTDLLGPTYDEECELRIVIILTPTGFIYTLSARLIQPASRDVFVNAGFHPYFRTPTGNARVGTWLRKQTRLYQRTYGPRNEPVGQGAYIIAPDVGKTQLLLGGAWNTSPSKRLVVWRDSRKYACVEPILGNPRVYGKQGCPKLTEKWLEMRCEFQVTL